MRVLHLYAKGKPGMTTWRARDPFLRLEGHLPATTHQRRRVARWAGCGIALCLFTIPIGPAIAATYLSDAKPPMWFGIVLASNLCMSVFLVAGTALGIVRESTRPLHPPAEMELVKLREFNPRVRHALDRWHALGRSVTYREFWLIKDVLRQCRQAIIQPI